MILSLALALAEPHQASAAVVLTNVTLIGNGSRGIRVRDAATVAAHDVTVSGNHGGGVLVAAGRLDMDGTSAIDGNLGGSPVAFGAMAAPGAVLTLTGTQATPILVNGNAGVGLLLLGNFSGAFVEVATNGIQGVWVDTVDAPAFADPNAGGPLLRNAAFVACDIHGNGTNPGVYPPGGLTVLRTRTSTATAAERFQLTFASSGGFIASQVHDNLGDGVTLGGSPVPATGLCAILPAPLACGAVDALVEDATVSGNHRGIVIQELNESDSGTVPLLLGDTIKGNSDVGLYVYTSHVLRDPTTGYAINGNLIGHNGFSDATCTSQETASQVIFDGPVAPSAATAAQCAAAATEYACDSLLACVWNSNLPSDYCRPAYPFSAVTCEVGLSNTITGYCRACGGPSVFEAGVVVIDGAWVNALNNSWMVAGVQEGIDWSAVGGDSFLSTASAVCSSSSICP